MLELGIAFVAGAVTAYLVPKFFAFVGKAVDAVRDRF